MCLTFIDYPQLKFMRKQRRKNDRPTLVTTKLDPEYKNLPREILFVKKPQQ